MKILIVRCGSGWGGIVRRCLFDTDLKIRIDLDKCYSVTKDAVYFKTDVLKIELCNFPQEAISPCNFNLSLLECFLPDCNLKKDNYTMFDQQIDYVYILKDNHDIQCVYDTYIGISPENPALEAKLKMLISCVS